MSEHLFRGRLVLLYVLTTSVSVPDAAIRRSKLSGEIAEAEGTVRISLYENRSPGYWESRTSSGDYSLRERFSDGGSSQPLRPASLKLTLC